MKESGFMESFIEVNNEVVENKDIRVVAASNAMDLYLKKSLFGDLMIKEIDFRKINSILLAEVSKLDIIKRIETLKKTPFIGSFYEKLDMLIYCSSLLELGIWRDGIVMSIFLERIPNAMKESIIHKDLQSLDDMKNFAKKLDELKSNFFKSVSPASSIYQQRTSNRLSECCSTPLPSYTSTAQLPQLSNNLSNISTGVSHMSHENHLSLNANTNNCKEMSLNETKHNTTMNLSKRSDPIKHSSIIISSTPITKSTKTTQKDVLGSSIESLNLSDIPDFDNKFIPTQVSKEKKQITKEIAIIDAGTDINLSNSYLDPTQYEIRIGVSLIQKGQLFGYGWAADSNNAIKHQERKLSRSNSFQTVVLQCLDSIITFLKDQNIRNFLIVTQHIQFFEVCKLFPTGYKELTSTGKTCLKAIINAIKSMKGNILFVSETFKPPILQTSDAEAEKLQY
uniref:RNase H domain-containing protein n=1 Tax=Strongyloides venezuelensis TaxID=75913 RepID=A0A0K0FWH8_STRVS